MTDSTSIFQQALAAHKNQNPKEAKKLYLNAISINNSDALSHNNIGLIFFEEKNIKKAIFHFSKAVSVNSKDITFLRNLVTALEIKNEHSKVAHYSLIALSNFPHDSFFILSHLISLLKLNNDPAAFKFLSSLRNVRIPEVLIHSILITYSNIYPKHHPILTNSLGMIYKFFEKSDQYSVTDIIATFRFKSDDCFLLELLQKLLHLGFYDSVLDKIFKLLEHSSCSEHEALRLGLIGIGKNRLGDNKEALHFLKMAHHLQPKNKLILNELSQAYALNGELSIAINLARDNSLNNMVSIYDNLNNRNFKSAWSTYLTAEAHKLRKTSTSAFSRKGIMQKRILLFRDQGIGDEIMFLSCLPDLIKDSPKELYIECSPRIECFIKRSFPKITKVIPVDPTDNSIKKFAYLDNDITVDEAIRVSELPYHYRLTLGDFSQKALGGYFLSDKKLSAIWRSRLDTLPNRFNIGIAWKGGINFKRGFKGTKFELLEPLLKLDNINWINMQYGEISEEKSFFKKLGVKLHTWNDINYTDDLEQIGSLSSELDLLIQINNTSLHLAGSLGVNTWCLLLHGNFDIRWFEGENNNDCPWYPSVSLFRQSEGQSLKSYIYKLTSHLKTWIDSHD